MIRNAFVCAACGLALLVLNACGSSRAPVATNQQGNAANPQATSNSGPTQSAHAPAAAVSPRSANSATARNVEPVDTSKYDAEINRLEEKLKKTPTDQQTRLALGKAYADRGDALTGVRQYSAALGDYRRALRNDPNNEQARQMAGTIISIYKSMGREVPEEGHEQTPVTVKQ